MMPCLNAGLHRLPASPVDGYLKRTWRSPVPLKVSPRTGPPARERYAPALHFLAILPREASFAALLRGFTAVDTPTPDVANQSSELVDYNLFGTNPALVDALAREGSASDHDRLMALRERLGNAEKVSPGAGPKRQPP